MGCGVSNVVAGKRRLHKRRSRKDNPVGVFELRSGDIVHKLTIQGDGTIILDKQYARSVIYSKGGKSFTFKMSDSCETSGAEFMFVGEDSINGQITQRDGDTYMIRGTLAKEEDDEKVKGEPSVVIDDTTLKRYTEIQKKLEEYEEQDVEAKVMELSALAERKHATIKQKVTVIEGLKAQYEVTVKQHGEASQEALTAKEEYETAQLGLKTEAKEYKTICDKLKLYTGDLFDYNILSQQFDDLLQVVFGGENGTYLENELEKSVDELEAKKRRVDRECGGWKNAFTDLQNVGSMLLKAVKYWGSIAPPEGPSDEGVTMEAKETRSLVILSLESLECVDEYLEGVEGYKERSKEIRKELTHFICKIYEYETNREGLSLALGADILQRAREDTRRSEQWLYDTHLREKIEDSETMRLRIMEEKLKLKNERRRFIGEWLNDNVGESGSAAVSPLPSEGAPALTAGDKEDTSTTVESSEFDLEATYNKITEDLGRQEKKRQLESTRAEIDLQEKIRERRQRQRRLRGQKLQEVKHSETVAVIESVD